jgi:hypothetical protein
MKTLTRTLACIAILTIACGTMMAADRLPDRAITVGAGVIHPMPVEKKPWFKTLYTNLGSSTDAYYSTNGWLVAGSASALGHEQWIAMPVTLSGNHTLNEIEIALTYDNSGTNAAEVVFAADSSGLPGKTIKSWDVKNLPTFGTCCTLVVVKDKKGIKLKANTQYWVIGQTDSKSADAYDSWDYTYNLVTGNFAYNIGSGWTSYDSDLSAFALRGVK